jgi:hypothetical protein
VGDTAGRGHPPALPSAGEELGVGAGPGLPGRPRPRPPARRRWPGCARAGPAHTAAPADTPAGRGCSAPAARTPAPCPPCRGRRRKLPPPAQRPASLPHPLSASTRTAAAPPTARRRLITDFPFPAPGKSSHRRPTDRGRSDRRGGIVRVAAARPLSIEALSATVGSGRFAHPEVGVRPIARPVWGAARGMLDLGGLCRGRNHSMSMRGHRGLRPRRRVPRDVVTSWPWGAGLGHRQLGHRPA